MPKKSIKPLADVLINIFTPVLPSYVNFVRRGTVDRTPTGRVCVVGKASYEDLDLIGVWAQIYRKESDIPTNRPSSAKQGNVLGNGFFEFTGDKEVPNARCNYGSAATNNWLAVWVEFPGGVTGRETRRFHGECNDEFCECDRPATVKKAAKKKGAKKKAKTAKKKAAKAAKKVVKKKTKRPA